MLNISLGISVILTMDELQKHEMYKELVGVAVEHALITMGIPELQKVEISLKKHGMKTSDCLDHPEHLKKILKDLFGNSYQDIIDTIYIVLEHAKKEKMISDFLYEMEL